MATTDPQRSFLRTSQRLAMRMEAPHIRVNYDDMIQATKDALSQRDSRRDLLAKKLETMAEKALDAARATSIDLGDAGRIEQRTATATCSQWANGDYPRGGEERYYALVIGDVPRALTGVDCSFWDGHNMQHQQGKARDAGHVIHNATVAQLRAAAKALPKAIAMLLTSAAAKATQESAETEETLASL